MTLQISSLQREVDLPGLCEAVYGSSDDGRQKKPRLKSARDYFFNLQQEDIPILIDVFKYWRDYEEYLLMQGEHRVSGEKKFRAVKASKRGNDVYGKITRKKLGFLKNAENLVFFTHEDFTVKDVVKIRLVWLILTWDPGVCSLNDAWYGRRNSVFVEGKEDGVQLYVDGILGRLEEKHVKGCPCVQCKYNLYITNLRNKYGRIQVLRFPQAFPSQDGSAYGYPHLHLVLLFQDHEFTVFPHMNNKEKLEYRIHERDEVKDQGNWHYFSDIKAISSMKGIYNYAVKHHENAGFGNSYEAVLNNSVCWLYKKKSYTISGSFRITYTEFIGKLCNSKVVGQVTLVGGFISDWKYTLLGVFSFFDFDLLIDPPDDWCFDVSSEVVSRLMLSIKKRVV